MTALDGFPAVGLDELVAQASLLTRVDRKYVVDGARVSTVLSGLQPYARALEIDGARDFGYASTYYDDAALTSFHLSARGRRRRFKVRTRTYAESGRSFVEVKTRGSRGTTVKHRLALTRTAGAWDSLPDQARAFIEQTLSDFGVRAQTLSPVLHTTYRRSTLLADASRVTIDTGLLWCHVDGARLPLTGCRGAGDQVRAARRSRRPPPVGAGPATHPPVQVRDGAVRPGPLGPRQPLEPGDPPIPLVPRTLPHSRSDPRMKLPRRTATTLASLSLAVAVLTGCGTTAADHHLGRLDRLDRLDRLGLGDRPGRHARRRRRRRLRPRRRHHGHARGRRQHRGR